MVPGELPSGEYHTDRNPPSSTLGGFPPGELTLRSPPSIVDNERCLLK